MLFHICLFHLYQPMLPRFLKNQLQIHQCYLQSTINGDLRSLRVGSEINVEMKVGIQS
jgi:hypothetical protein